MLEHRRSCFERPANRIVGRAPHTVAEGGLRSKNSISSGLFKIVQPFVCLSITVFHNVRADHQLLIGPFFGL